MIKKIQKNFIIIVMAILLFVFAIIFIATFVIEKNQNNRIIVDKLNAIERTFDNSDTAVKDVCDIIKISFYDESSDYVVFETIQNDDDIKTSKLREIIKYSVKNNYEFGHKGEFSYKLVMENGYLFIYNTTAESETLRGNLLKTTTVLLVLYFLLFLVCYALSFKFVNLIKDSLNSQRQFISNASHELKTPIAVISANTEVLKNIDDNQWVENIGSQTERLTSLVSNMLELTKLEEDNNTLKKEKFNLSDIVIGTALSFDALAFENQKNLTLNVPNGIEYFGDVESVKKILSILIDNSIKYASNKGEITVSLKQEQKTVLTVYNTGSNVPDFESNRIFERFYRGDNSRSRDSGGSGLGLSIAQNIAIVNGWKISAKSVFGKSMTITVIM